MASFSIFGKKGQDPVRVDTPGNPARAMGEVVKSSGAVEKVKLRDGPKDGLPAHLQSRVDDAIIDDSLPKVQKYVKGKEAELRSLKRKTMIAKVANKLRKFGNKRVVSRDLVRREGQGYDISAGESNSNGNEDRSRFFNKTFEVEKRKLFFRG
jgi:hypothetical protein